MKTLILMSLAVMTLSGTAHARGEHCRSQDDYCQQNYRKSDAFKVILNAEGGDVADANGNLRVIEQVVQQYRIGFEPAVGNFLYLFQKLGGPYYTNLAQATFKTLAQYTGPRLSLAKVVDSYIEVYEADGSDSADASQGLATVMNSRNRGSFDDRLKLYLNLHRLLGGPYYTNLAISTFNMISQYSNEYHLADLYQAYSELYQAEGSDSADASGNFQLVLRGARKCGSLQEATDEFLSLLSTLGGPYYTNAAQQQYKSLFGL